MRRFSLPSKLTTETKLVSADFLTMLASGETITNQQVLCGVYIGTDASPGNVISGGAFASGTSISQEITGGVAGNVYDLIFAVTTSAGQTLEQAAYQAVLAP